MTKSLAAQRLVVLATDQAVAAMTPLPHTVGQTLIDANLSRTDETARPDVRPVALGEVLLRGVMALPFLMFSDPTGRENQDEYERNTKLIGREECLAGY